MGRRGRRCKQILDNLKEKKIVSFERGSTRSQSVKNPLWKIILTSRKTTQSKYDTWLFAPNFSQFTSHLDSEEDDQIKDPRF